MKTFLKVILLLLWYALVGVGSYALIIYGLNIEVEWWPTEQIYLLYGGIGILLLSLIIAIMLLVTPRKAHKKENVDALPAVQQPTAADEPTENEPETTNIDTETESNPSEMVDQTTKSDVNDSTIGEPQINDSAKQVESEIESMGSTVSAEPISQDDNNGKSLGMTLDDLPSLDNEEENSENETADDFIENVTETQTTSSETENKTSEALASPVAQTSSPVEPVVKMTETQQQFIRDSKNSYLNTEGLPQFKITKQIDAKAIVAQENKRLDELEQPVAGKPSKLPLAVKILIIVFSIAAGLAIAWLIYTYLIK